MAHLTSHVIYTQHIFATKQAGQWPYTQDRYPHQGRFGCPTQLYQSQASQNLDEARQGQIIITVITEIVDLLIIIIIPKGPLQHEEIQTSM